MWEAIERGSRQTGEDAVKLATMTYAIQAFVMEALKHVPIVNLEREVARILECEHEQRSSS